MWTRQLDWIEPVDAARRLAHLPRLALLDSAMTHPTLGRWSWLAADPFATFVAGDGGVRWNGEALAGAPLALLRERLARYALPRDEAPAPLACGAVGRFAYEWGWALERRAPPHPRVAPDIDLAFHDVALAFDHRDRRCLLVASGHPAPTPAGRRARAAQRLDAFAKLLV